MSNIFENADFLKLSLMPDTIQQIRKQTRKKLENYANLSGKIMQFFRLGGGAAFEGGGQMGP